MDTPEHFGLAGTSAFHPLADPEVVVLQHRPIRSSGYRQLVALKSIADDAENSLSDVSAMHASDE